MHDGLPLILDRDAELAAVSDASRGAAGGDGSVVLVTGPDGIGKTALMRAARAGTGTAVRVLTARGMALEQDFSFGIVRQLFEPVRAAVGPGGWDELLDGGSDPHAATHGLYWLTANLAARQQLLIMVDDAHWADAPSLRWLSHLAARIEDLPVVLMVAARSGPDLPEVIDELPDLPSCTVLALRPLSAEATATLVRAHLSPASDDAPAPDDTRETSEEPDDEFCAACHGATGGNPFLLQALLVALREARDTTVPLTPAMVTAAGPRPVATAAARRV
ncbi:MAG: AAA family ATPase, partial [Nocardiopsaceae bacterium]|nr:AAA family ATPase [Nocardiopsaceae bacterium]